MKLPLISKPYRQVFIYLLFIAVFPLQTVGQEITDTLSAKQKYQAELAELTKEFERDGYRINMLMKDERFEVYGSIGDRFKNSAERTTPTLAEYKDIIAFDEKVDGT